MRYAYRNLGERAKGETVIVRWSGGASADVLLLDPVQFTKYREAKLPVRYSHGGRYRRSPAELTVPEDGRWYVVADLHGYGTLAESTVEIPEPGDGQGTREEQLIGAA